MGIVGWDRDLGIWYDDLDTCVLVMHCTGSDVKVGSRGSGLWGIRVVLAQKRIPCVNPGMISRHQMRHIIRCSFSSHRLKQSRPGC